MEIRLSDEEIRQAIHQYIKRKYGLEETSLRLYNLSGSSAVIYAEMDVMEKPLVSPGLGQVGIRALQNEVLL